MSEQKKELSKWHERNPDTKKGIEKRCKKQRGPSKKQISAAVAKKLKKLVSEKAKEDNNEANTEAYIQVMIQAAIAKSSNCWKPSSPFSNVHFRNTTKIAAQVLCS